MAYPTAKKQAVMHAYLSGKYKSVKEIAEAFNIPRVQTIHEWISRENWDKSLDEFNKAKDPILDQTSQIERMKREHYQIWTRLRGHLAEHINRAIKRNQPMSINDLEKATRILERIQKGRRIAKDADVGPINVGDNEIKIDYKSLEERSKEVEGKDAEFKPAKGEED